ncbi:MAG: glycosyltransferase [Planctomycetaceae bacterium]
MISSMEGGGSERQTLLLLRHLSRERFLPELMVLRRGGSLYDQIPSDVPVHCLSDGLPRWRVRWPGRIHHAQVAALRKLLVDREIAVVYDRTFHMSLIAGPAAAAAGVPRVSTIVSPPSRAVPLNAGKFVAIKRRRLARAYATAKQVIAVSQPTAVDARRYYGLTARQVLVIPNPVDQEELIGLASADAAPPRDARYTIVCVGRMSEEKGQRDLLLALDRLRRHYPDFQLPRLWLVGDGPQRKAMEAMSAKLRLEDCVVFVGHVTNPAPWVATADALCLPSLFEGFPNVMLEAMALGTPVIASDLPIVRSLGRVAANPEDRGRDYVAMYHGRDVNELARKIRRLWLNSTATRSRMLSAKNLALRAHSIERILPRIESIMLQASQTRTVS